MATGLLDGDLARAMLDTAADCGLDLATLIDGDDATLRRTDVAQPALLLVECVLHAALPEHDGVVAVAGHSVGEYAACVAAGAMTAVDAMRLVVARGRAMAAMREGTMRALLGLDAAAVEAICEEVRRESGEVVVVANLNAPGQVVLSGSHAAIDAACARAAGSGLRRAIPLNVSGAFHSPLMAEAATRFATELESVQLRDPRIPIVCNVDAADVRDAASLHDRLQRQLTSPVRWADTVRRLVALGAASLIEVGPGTVLTGLARRIAPDVDARAVGTVEQARHLLAGGVAS